MRIHACVLSFFTVPSSFHLGRGVCVFYLHLGHANNKPSVGHLSVHLSIGI